MMNKGGDIEMTKAVREGINDLIEAIKEEAGIATETFFEVVFVCNPVMHHLLLGIDPVELGQAPFALATSEALKLKTAELGLTAMNSSAKCYLLPRIAGHVGADAAAVALLRTRVV